MMADEDALTSAARAARKAGPNDRVVEIKKPLGLVLEENEKVCELSELCIIFTFSKKFVFIVNRGSALRTCQA
jgi:hypothetical protein